MLYYILSGFLTFLIDRKSSFIFLIILYYIVTNLVFRLFNKKPEELIIIKDAIYKTLNVDYIFTGIANAIKAVTDFFYNLFDMFWLTPLRAVMKYSNKWVEWISSGKAGDYVIELVMDTINFLIFQIQELINNAFIVANKTFDVIPKLDLKLVDLPEEAYVLDDIF